MMKISRDESLGDGFQIGHSYLCGLKSCDKVKEIIFYDIIPMLHEYWFDDKQKVDFWENELKELILMTNDKNILIQNIYYMLAYAFQVLKRNNYTSINF